MTLHDAVHPRGSIGRRLAPVVCRHHLFSALNYAGRVTQISAPAGSGKSVLVRSWVAHEGLEDRVGWVTVARNEQDAQRFWLTVLEALTNDRARASAITPAPPLEPPTLLARVLTEMDSFSERFWLVIDDLHELSSAEGELEQLLEAAPHSVRFVLLTRRDLRLGLHRLRLTGELSEIRQADLRFDLEESRTLFADAGVPLSEESLEVLVDRTEGWAAGLGLAVRSLSTTNSPDLLAAGFSGSQRAVAEYLLAEVLDRQPAEVTRLLLRTSILDRVSGPLADRLTGDNTGRAILMELEEAGAFVISVDSDRSWFRYHHLFADLLALELRRSHPDELVSLHEAAAGWFEEHGMAVDAIRHAQSAENWALAAGLLADHWYDLYFDGRRATAHQLLQQFPAGFAAVSAELAVVCVADAISCGAPDEAQRYLELAQREVPLLVEPRRSRLEIALAELALYLARTRNDLPSVVAEAQRLLRRSLISVGDDVALAGTIEALALCNLGAAEITIGSSDDATEHLRRARTVAARIGRPMIEVVALGLLALLEVIRSRRGAERLSREAIELARCHGWDDEPFLATAHAVQGLACLYRGRLDDATASFKLADRCLRADLDPTVRVTVELARGLRDLACADYGQALTHLDVAARASEKLATPYLQVALEEARWLALIKLDEIDTVAAALDAMNDIEAGSCQSRVVQGALRLATGDAQGAAASIAKVGSLPEADQRCAIEARLVQALAHHELHDSAGASRALEQALDLAEPSGLLLPFLVFPVGELLAGHARAGTAHASLVAEICDLMLGRVPGGELGAYAPLEEPLSKSELRVLRYLSTNLLAPEIASELFLSVNTVRTHIRHVYAKLGVHRRDEAVQHARRRGLLAPSARRPDMRGLTRDTPRMVRD